MMAENEIILLHDRLYEYLKGLHRANPHFMFWLREFPHALKPGYWFTEKGDSKENMQHIVTSFMEGFEETYSYDCHISYDTTTHQWIYTLKEKYWTETQKASLTSLGFVNNWGGTWNKVVSVIDDFLKPLDFFIKNEKPIIEAPFVRQTGHWNKDYLRRFKQNIKKIDLFRKSTEGKTYYKLLAEMSKPHLPFALSRLEISDFQGIKHLIIEDIPIDTQWIFLTGENGTGKTSLLRAVAKGFLGDEEQVKQIELDSHIHIAGVEKNTAFFRKVLKGKATASNTFGYGIARFRTAEAEKGGNAYSLFEEDGTLLNIETALIAASPERFEQIKSILKKIVPNLYNIQKIYENGFAVLKYQEKSELGNGFPPVLLKNLAAGFRGLITLVGDMLRRFTPTLDKPTTEMEGIVLIDEFDAHLHPKYQYELPKLLSDAFPKVQFIVSTHSPIPLLGVKPDTAVVLTVHRTEAAGITVERLDDDIPLRHLLPNALLTSPIFGFETLFPRDTPPAQIITSDHWKDVEASFDLRKELAQLKRGGFMD